MGASSEIGTCATSKAFWTSSGWNSQALRDARLTASLLHQLANGSHQLVDPLKHVNGNTNRSPLVSDAAHQRLPNPPGRISGKLVPTTVLELIHRLHQANVSFLDQVDKFQPPIDEFLSDRHHQAKVCLHELMLRG